MFNVRFVLNKGCKRDDGVSDLQQKHHISLNGDYVNSMRVYMGGRFKGLIVVTKKYDDGLNTNYYHQSYSYRKGVWERLTIEANTLEASQKVFMTPLNF